MKLEEKIFTSINHKGELIRAVLYEDAIDYGVECYKDGVEKMKDVATKIINEYIKQSKGDRYNEGE